MVNLNTTFRNSGDIELLSNLIFNNKNSLFQKKIKELVNENNPKEVNIIKSNNKNIPLDLINFIQNNLNQLKKSTLNLSKKKIYL